MFRHNILLAKPMLTGRWPGGSIRVQELLKLRQKAHICLVTDEQVNKRIRTGLRKSYRVALVKKSATQWYERLLLHIVRSLESRGRITLIER